MAVRPGNREGKLRSVDSERTGRVIEPRNLCNVEADAFGCAEGNTDVPARQRDQRPCRGLRHRHERKRSATATPLALQSSSKVRARRFHRGLRAGHERKGPPRNLGDLAVSVAQAAVLPSDEKIGARRDERRGVGAPRSTAEAGTAARVSRRGASVRAPIPTTQETSRGEVTTIHKPPSTRSPPRRRSRRRSRFPFAQLRRGPSSRPACFNTR